LQKKGGVIEMADKKPEKPVYENEQFRIVRNPMTTDCYDLWIGKRQEDGTSRIHFYLPRGMLENLANTAEGELLNKFTLINPVMAVELIVCCLRPTKYGFGWRDLRTALMEAANNEERRYKERGAGETAKRGRRAGG
jgi:hypothetical protein